MGNNCDAPVEKGSDKTSFLIYALVVAWVVCGCCVYANLVGPASGPTSWMPPLLPALEAGLLWTLDGNKKAVEFVVICLQTLTLAGTGILVLAVIRATARRMGAGVIVFLVLLCAGHFYLAFQQTHDHWLVLLFLNGIVAWLCWGRPLAGAKSWGLYGGLCALVSPILGLVWATLSIALAWRQRTWKRLIVAGSLAGVVILLWTARNYLVFGRLPLPCGSSSPLTSCTWPPMSRWDTTIGMAFL
jgi:hypothetical protein